MLDDSIMTSVKHMVGLQPEYTAFDSGILMYINSAFASLENLGASSSINTIVEDETALWSELNVASNELSLIKSYIFLKVRMLFDPPTTSYLISAMEKQLSELEFRIHTIGGNAA